MTTPAELLDFPPALRHIRNNGNCQDTDTPDDFFPARTSLGHYQIITWCRPCPVRYACLQWALDHHEHGVWGGMTERQRRQLTRP
jgi:WhiB family redox-sensing transcriptional regulator